MSIKDSVANPQDIVRCVVLANQDTSNIANLGGMQLVGIIAPANITSKGISFLVSADSGVTFSPLYDKDGVLVTVHVDGIQRYVGLGTSFHGIHVVKLQTSDIELADAVFMLIVEAD